MNIRKMMSVLILLAIGIGVVAFVKNNDSLKRWVENVSNGDRILSASIGMQIGNVGANTSGEAGLPHTQDSQEEYPAFPSDINIPQQSTAPQKDDVILPTTIEGGMVVKNSTSLILDLPALLLEGPSQQLSKDGVQILIIHTHASESYFCDDNSYITTDNYRTEDKNYNVVRVGDELAACFESYGLNVIHDRDIYDYPSYNGSYPRSGQKIENYLKEHPEIAIVIDLHRDAIGNNDVVYKTVAEADGTPCSQLMLLVGTSDAGLDHPRWMENMKLALYLQSAAINKYPTLMRPIAISEYRYNQQLTTGSLILEAGSSGNTLKEAIQAVRLFADATAPALLELVAE